MTSARQARIPPRLPLEPGWTNPAFARVADIVQRVSGLVFPLNRQAGAESGMRRAMSALRITDPDALGPAILSPGDMRDVVLAEITVGETYFFRESAQLDVLRAEVLPRVLAQGGGARPLHIWSAGCASGEEPYTIAILLRELGWSHPFTILGTDVAVPRLQAARRGRYTRWSMRGVSEARVKRWFAPRGTQFDLDPTIRSAVDFRLLNLMADDYPASAPRTTNCDVVLCRNVLIYFEMPTVERIATRLLASLAPDGWLLLGASDPPLSGLVPCEVVVTAGGVAYRVAKVSRRPVAVVPPSPHISWLAQRALVETVDEIAVTNEPPQVVALASVVTHEAATTPPLETSSAAQPARDERDDAAAYAAADYPLAEARARAAVDADPLQVDSWTVLVRALANRGLLREADACCVSALDLHRLSPELHSLHATLLSAAGQFSEAAHAARRALYLDRRFVMAHLQLGDALMRTGDQARARQAFSNALAILDTSSEDAVVTGADGVSVSRLRQAAHGRVRAADGDGER